MKRNILLLFLISIMIFSACTKSKQDILQQSTQATLDGIDKEIVASDLLNSYDENFGEYDKEFIKIIENNPIDKAMLSEHKDSPPQTTVEMLEFAEKYGDFWTSEMEQVLKKLKKLLGEDALKALNGSQKEWKKYCEGELSLLYEMYISTSGEGLIVSLASSYKAVSLYRNRTIELAYYYYVLSGEFNFEFIGS